MGDKNSTLFFVQGNPKSEYADATVLGVAWDENASYGKGAALAPEAIIKASHQMDVENPLTGQTLETAIHNFGIIKPKNVGQMIKAIDEKAKKSLDAKKMFILLGGDHSVVNGLLDAVPKSTTFVNFDAHLDLREKWQGKTLSHAAVGRRILEKGFDQVWVGVRDMINEEEMGFVAEKQLAGKIFYCPSMPRAFYRKHTFPAWMHKKNMMLKKTAGKNLLRAILSKIGTEKAWLNIDIDCLDLRQGVETGVPTAFGMTLEALREIVFEICDKRQVIGFNICEVIPDKYGKGQAIAADLCFKIVSWT